jgi:16S rRNA (guanine(966)-N(2))-methyltransferase RsmD
MRIIAGKHQRRIVKPPANLPVRPTTDIAKEALFNILNNISVIEGSKVLDLFAGTGSMSYEFASRGAVSVVSVDLNFKCIEFIKKTKRELDLQNLFPFRSDAFRYLQGCKSQFDIIFADPPYSLEGIEKVHSLVFENNLLAEEGLLIMEHPETKTFENFPYFVKERKYGKVHFSFFEKQPN